MKRLQTIYLLILGALVVPAFAYGQFQPLVPTGPASLPPLPNPVITDPGSLAALYEGASHSWIGQIQPYALELFAALAFLEFAAFGWSLWKTYHWDVSAAIMSTGNKVLIIGVFLSILLNGQEWGGDILAMFDTVGKAGSGVATLTPSFILLKAFQIFGKLFWQSTKSGFFADIPTAVATLFAGAMVCLSFVAITLLFIATKVQTFLAVGLGYFFLAFGGSNWTTPYVERYFAFCVASGAKLMSMYFLIGIGIQAADGWIAQAQTSGDFLSSVENSWSIMCGALLFAGICWFASSQISAVLGGSPNLSHSDVVSFMGPMITAAVGAGMVAAGIAAAPATGGASAAAGGGAAATATGAAAGGATPAVAASGGSSGASTAVRAAGQFAQVGASAVRGMPSGGGHTPPPHFSGFSH